MVDDKYISHCHIVYITVQVNLIWIEVSFLPGHPIFYLHVSILSFFLLIHTTVCISIFLKYIFDVCVIILSSSNVHLYLSFMPYGLMNISLNALKFSFNHIYHSYWLTLTVFGYLPRQYCLCVLKRQQYFVFLFVW